MNVLSKKYGVLESKITKILNSEENSKRKVPNQMAKSKAQTYYTKKELQLRIREIYL